MLLYAGDKEPSARLYKDRSGNKYRLIAVVDYVLQSVSIKCVLTHAEYGEGRWRK